MKILVAEDIESNYILIKALLKDHDLTHVYNGLEAVKEAENQNFDAILMDIRMPVMDGVEATRRIREFNAEIPIIAVTGYAFEEIRNRAIEAGISDFLTKPLDRARLLETLGRH